MSKIIQIQATTVVFGGFLVRSVVALTDDGRVLRYEDNDRGSPRWEELPPILPSYEKVNPF